MVVVEVELSLDRVVDVVERPVAAELDGPVAARVAAGGDLQDVGGKGRHDALGAGNS